MLMAKSMPGEKTRGAIKLRASRDNRGFIASHRGTTDPLVTLRASAKSASFPTNIVATVSARAPNTYVYPPFQKPSRGHQMLKHTIAPAGDSRLIEAP